MRYQESEYVSEEDYPQENEWGSTAWEASVRDVSPKDWKISRYLEHNPLVDSEDEVRVIRFNFSQPRSGRAHPSEAERAHPVNSTKDNADPVAKYQRRCWFLLSVASLIWGGISGAAFVRDGFPVTPSGALLGAFGLIVLALTLLRLGRTS